MYPMSNRNLARPLPQATIRPDSRFRDQSPQRNWTRVNLLVSVHPNKDLSEASRWILKNLKLDGHWYLSVLTTYLTSGLMDFQDPEASFWDQFEAFCVELLPDLLVEDLVAALSEGPDQDHLVRKLDDLLQEEGRVLLEDGDYALRKLCSCIRLHSDLCASDLAGYTVIDTHTGALAFDLDSELYENHSTL